MHYYIDGYNMLFRLSYAVEDLSGQREMIIQELSKKIELVKIDVSIVFDAAFQFGLGTKSHYQQLEILFTDQGESADDFIIEALKSTRYPQQETIVTSDKQLAWRARRGAAQTETIEEFLVWLNKAYKKKLRLLTPLKSSSTYSLPTLEKIEPSPTLPIKETTEENYQLVFEERYQELIKNEPIKRKKSPPVSFKQKKTKEKKRKQKPTDLEEIKNPEERWLKAFNRSVEDWN